MPTLKPNQRAVDGARAIDGARTEYSIEGVPGLKLRVAPSGGATWMVVAAVGRGRVGRQLRRVTIGSARAITVGRAVQKSREIIAAARLGELTARADLTFGQLFERWHSYCASRKKPRSHADERALFDRHIRGRLGHLLASQIKRVDITAALDDIARRATPIQANRCQTIISSVFSWAVDEGLAEAHPAYRIRKRGVERPRSRTFSEMDIARIWRGCDELRVEHRLAIRLLLLLGLRRSEIAEAAKPEVDLSACTLSIRAIRRKAWRPGRPELPHVVPLPPLARQLFEEALEEARRSAYVFPVRTLRKDAPMRGTHLSATFRQMMCRLDIADARLHDLRSIVKTGMAQLGVPPAIADKVQDHAEVRGMGKAYDRHDYLSEKRRALELWEKRLLEIVEARGPSGLSW